MWHGLHPISLLSALEPGLGSLSLPFGTGACLQTLPPPLRPKFCDRASGIALEAWKGDRTP